MAGASEPSVDSAAAAQRRVGRVIEGRMQQLMQEEPEGAAPGSEASLHTNAVLQEAAALSQRLAEMQVGCCCPPAVGWFRLHAHKQCSDAVYLPCISGGGGCHRAGCAAQPTCEPTS
jgi:hypothetical protein